jgi:hypothetical protein
MKIIEHGITIEETTAAARVHIRANVGFAADKAALGQVFSEYFGFPCQSLHKFLHHRNHPGLAQQAYWWPQSQVDPVGLHPLTIQIKKMLEEKSLRRNHINYVVFFN